MIIMIPDQNCTTQSSLALLHPFGQYQYFIDPVAGLFKAEKETLLLIFLYAKLKLIQFRAQNSVIREYKLLWPQGIQTLYEQ